MIFDWKKEAQRQQYYLLNLKRKAGLKPIRSFGELTVTLLTISFFVYFAIKPTFIIIAGLNKELGEKKEISDKLRQKITSLVTAQQEFSLYQDRFYLIDQALPEIPDFSLLILSLEKEASAAGVAFQSFSISKIESSQSVKTSQKIPQSATSFFNFSFSASGDYSSLKQFLSRLENLRRLATIKTITFTQNKKDEKNEQKTQLIVTGQADYYLTRPNPQ